MRPKAPQGFDIDELQRHANNLAKLGCLIWPPPIPIAEWEPIYDTPMLACVVFGDESRGWYQLQLDKTTGWHNTDTWWLDSNERVTHVLPMPPEPEQEIK